MMPSLAYACSHWPCMQTVMHENVPRVLQTRAPVGTGKQLIPHAPDVATRARVRYRLGFRTAPRVAVA